MKLVMVLYPCPAEEAGEETPVELLGRADMAEYLIVEGGEIIRPSYAAAFE